MRQRGGRARLLGVVVLSFTSLAVVTASGAAAAATPTAPSPAPAPCTWNFTIDAITGIDGSASAIGWAGNHQGVATCLGGSFYVQDGINKTYGFGVYSGGPTTWVDASGYLPAQITTFHRAGALVHITEFADQITLGGDDFVALYARVSVNNATGHIIDVDPAPSTGLLPLSEGPDSVPAHHTVDHDYVMAVDRFGNSYPWPSASALQGAGSFDQHFAHMAAFWNAQLSQIAQISLPDRQLVDAYKSGFIYTQIARSGVQSNTGVNGYESEFSHDVIGILSNLFTQGDFENAHALLLEDDRVVAMQGQYEDGIWTYDWPWAIYLLKTGDLSFIKAHFSTPGPGPSIEQTAHEIAADRTGPGGIIGETDDIDTNGLWTVDDYEALMGLAAYGYLAQQVGNTTEALWAVAQYNSLLTAVNTTLSATIAKYHLHYLPCSIVQPNTANRCRNPRDANWAATLQFGHWAWDGSLFGVPITGPGAQLIDATYDYGFDRLKGLLPPDTYGGYPDDYYSTGYNAGYGSWGLASTSHRDQGILGYEFMIAHDQSGPYSWWESSSPPPAHSNWLGSHPAAGQGASPHAWGIAEANKVLLDSLVAQANNGNLIVGRGVPDSWLHAGEALSVNNFPTTDNRRIDVHIVTSGDRVTLTLSGGLPSGRILFQLPVFIHDLAATSAGVMDQASGTVSLPPHTTMVTVRLRHLPA